MISNLNVLKKMLIIGILTLLSFVVISTIFLVEEKHILISEKKSKLVNIVELPYSLIESEYKAFLDGKIDADKITDDVDGTPVEAKPEKNPKEVKKESPKPDQKSIDFARPLLKKQMKGLIARDLFSVSEYFQIMFCNVCKSRKREGRTTSCNVPP